MAAKKGVMRRILDLEPLLARGGIVAVLGMVGVVMNMQFTEGTAEQVGNVVFAAFGLLTAIISRGKVTPNKKVLTYQPDPVNRPNAIESGAGRDPE